MGPLHLSPSRRAWITLGVMLSIFLGALEATAVVTAMPTVVSYLGGLELYGWVYSIYFLSATVTVPLWGRLSDLYGRRLFFVAGIVLFVAGSGLCGLSRSMAQLVGFRALQGLGAGALLPLGMTIVADIYSLEKRARIQGLFSGVWGVSSIIGPLLGGLVTDYFSWRWVFFLNLPFGLLAGAIIHVALVEPETHGERRVDYLGALLLVAALVLLLVGLDPGVSGALGASRLWLLAGSLLLSGAFAWQQVRTRDPILPLHLFRDRIFASASISGLFSGMAMFGVISFIPLFVQGVSGAGATEAGWTLTPLLLGWVSFSILGSRLVLVLGYRTPVIFGMATLVLGTFLLWEMTAHSSRLQLTGALVLMGLGMGVSVISMLLAVQNRFSRQYLGIVTSATQFFRTIGAAIGIAVMGVVLSSGMLASFPETGGDPYSQQVEYLARHPDSIINPGARAELPPAVLEQLQEVLGEVLQDVFLVAFLASLLALGAAFWVPAGAARDHAWRRD